MDILIHTQPDMTHLTPKNLLKKFVRKCSTTNIARLFTLAVRLGGIVALVDDEVLGAVVVLAGKVAGQDGLCAVGIALLGVERGGEQQRHDGRDDERQCEDARILKHLGWEDWVARQRLPVAQKTEQAGTEQEWDERRGRLPWRRVPTARQAKEEEDEAAEKAGETEVQAARGKRAELYNRIGDKVRGRGRTRRRSPH